jgi:predicted GTPase
MTRGRILLLVILLGLPVLFLMGTGSYHLWTTGWTFWAWWPMGLCFATAYFLAWRWQKQLRTQQNTFTPPIHWTERDKAAQALIDERIKEAEKIPDAKFGEGLFYFETAQDLANRLARVYRPNAANPFSPVTVPELLTVIELASHDLNELIRKYVPGSHLMTVDHWQKVHQAVGWYKTATNAYWLGSALLDPIKTAVRFGAAKYGIGTPMGLFQQNVILWCYAAYVREVGFYLIELYSGRLKVGATRYRELMGTSPALKEVEKATTPSDPTTSEVPLKPENDKVVGGVGLVVVGQVKAGKSSLINALLGEQRAATDVVPMTNKITRYQLKSPGLPTELNLYDTVGYSQAGAEADQLEATAEAVQNADIVLLVCHGRGAARKADVDFIIRLQAWINERPYLKFPPLVVVLTHVDLLTPAMEWTPPYDWLTGERIKEKSMREAVAAAKEEFPRAAIVVPCCAAEGRVWNVAEGVLPAAVGQLGEAKGVALLRCLHAEADEGKVRRVFQQIWETGKRLYSLAQERV